jgi:peptide/nickel transport system substrate-binding protein
MQTQAPILTSMALLILLVGTACTGGGGLPPSPGGPTPTGHEVIRGSARFALDRWPQCLNPITACADVTSGQSTALQLVLPKLMAIDENGDPEASPLLDVAPTLENGGLTQDPFAVTFHLNPKAVWDDGLPITAFDVEFTLKAILNTRGTTHPIGYDRSHPLTRPIRRRSR